MALFESYERRIAQIEKVLEQYGISSLEEAEQITKDKGLNIYDQVRAIQPICFENACWAYTLGAALAIKKGQTRAADIAAAVFHEEKQFLPSFPESMRHSSIMRSYPQRIAFPDQKNGRDPS